MKAEKEILSIEDIFEGANAMLDEINPEKQVDNDTIIQWIIDKTLQSQLKEDRELLQEIKVICRLQKNAEYPNLYFKTIFLVIRYS